MSETIVTWFENILLFLVTRWWDSYILLLTLITEGNAVWGNEDKDKPLMISIPGKKKKLNMFKSQRVRNDFPPHSMGLED